MKGCIKSKDFNDGLNHETFKFLKTQDHVELPRSLKYMRNNNGANNQSNIGKVPMKVKNKNNKINSGHLQNYALYIS